jgi:hypothetical protein
VKSLDELAPDNFHNELMTLKLNITASTQQLYMRPGPIENKSLLAKGNFIKLTPNLMEHYDYEAVSYDVWKYLYAWYSADWSIARFLKAYQG